MLQRLLKLNKVNYSVTKSISFRNLQTFYGLVSFRILRLKCLYPGKIVLLCYPKKTLINRAFLVLFSIGTINGNNDKKGNKTLLNTRKKSCSSKVGLVKIAQHFLCSNFYIYSESKKLKSESYCVCLTDFRLIVYDIYASSRPGLKTKVMIITYYLF